MEARGGDIQMLRALESAGGRVALSCAVANDDGDLIEYVLPLVIGVVGNFSGATPDDTNRRAFFERDFVKMEGRSIGKLMRSLSPGVTIRVPDRLTHGGEASPLEFHFAPRSMADFDPNRLAQSVRELRLFARKRAALLALRPPGAQIGGAQTEAKTARAAAATLKLLNTKIDEFETGGEFNAEVRSIVESLRSEIKNKGEEFDSQLDDLISHAVQEIDAGLSAQMDEIYSSDIFREFEARWRGLYFFVKSLPPDEKIEVKVLDVVREELEDDLEAGRSTGRDVSGSHLFELLVSRAVGQFGGEPFGLLIVVEDFGRSSRDLDFLHALGEAGQAAHTPVLSAAAPDLLGIKDFSELGARRFAVDEMFSTGPFEARWKSLRGWREPGAGDGEERSSEPDRFLSLAFPRLLGRLPHKTGGGAAALFPYTERSLRRTGADGRDQSVVWINPAFGLAQVIATSFFKYRWCTAITGLQQSAGVIRSLPGFGFETAEASHPVRYPVETQLSEMQGRDFARYGLTPILPMHGRGGVVVHDAVTLAAPHVGRRGVVPISEVLRTWLAMVLAVSRVAHFLKVVMRESIGKNRTARDVEADLTRWLSRYMVRQDDVTPEIRAQRPLRDARVKVRDVPGKPGVFAVSMTLAPHMRLQGVYCSLTLHSESPSSG